MQTISLYYEGEEVCGKLKQYLLQFLIYLIQNSVDLI